MAVVAPEQFLAETDREGEHPDTAPARHQEMAKFMKEHDNRQDEDERNDVTGKIQGRIRKARDEIHVRVSCRPRLGLCSGRRLNAQRAGNAAHGPVGRKYVFDRIEIGAPELCHGAFERIRHNIGDF